MLWTEKYRPTLLRDIVGQQQFIDDALTWEHGMPNVLLYGTAGTGKTAAAGALANLILKDNKVGNFFEFNASDDRRLDVVRNSIKEIATTMSMGQVPHKIVLLDEMDGMTPDAQNALKRLMERYSDNVRFILPCNHRHKVIPPLQSRCANYGFKKLSLEDAKAVLNAILQLEGLPGIGDDYLLTLIRDCDGDLRRAITELQASVKNNTSITTQMDRMHQPYNDILDSILESKSELALNQMHDLIDQSVDMKTMCVGLHDVVLLKDMEISRRFQLLRIIGEAEWRCSNMTPKVLASWMIGQMI